MRDETREKRRREIEQAAYAVLAEKGYGGASMLAIAKKAGASNETLYRWYGGKAELFRSMIETNAGEISELLREAIAAEDDPIDTLARAGPVLLRLLTSDRAIALNRAAAADAGDTGVLGRALAEAGRNSVMPLIVSVFAQAAARGRLALDNPALAAETYLSLLVGDLQIRRAIGAIKAPGDEAVTERAACALTQTLALFQDGAG